MMRARHERAWGARGLDYLLLISWINRSKIISVRFNSFMFFTSKVENNTSLLVLDWEGDKT